ncbi:MAG: leucyl/phenylalanyl-tRNA--protein transferase [Hyphomicrobiales bacterium]
MIPGLPIEVHTRIGPQPLPPCAYRFPDPQRLRSDLAGEGADFEPSTIVEAYRSAAFPWPHPDEEYLWFSPDPRAIIEPGGLHVSRRLARTIRGGRFRATVDAAFPEVIRACAEPRGDDNGTWISPALRDAYIRLHELGWAHSIEVWCGDELAGGLYGVGVGAMFGAESMFHRVTDASKVAMVAMMGHAERLGLHFIDIQVITPHTARMGAIEIPRREYVARLARALDRQVDWAIGY